MRRIFQLVPFLFWVCLAQEVPDSTITDSMEVVSDTDRVSEDQSSIDSISKATPDSVQLQNWIALWWGNPQVAILSKQKWKIGDYDPKNLRFPVTGSVKEGKFEFGLTGFIPMDSAMAEKFRKAKGWKIQIQYHDRAIRLNPKRKDSRFVVIDNISLALDTLLIPILAEIWIPEKVVGSPGYQQWRDSLVSQGVLSNTERSWWNAPQGDIPVAMLRFGSVEWMSSYVSKNGGYSYRCAPNTEHFLCRKYSRESLDDLCPEGLEIPDTSHIRSLLNAWAGISDTGTSPMPFNLKFHAWEIQDADSSSKNKGKMLLTPWTGAGQIEPHLWSYVESFVKDAEGQVGLFQFGWSESSWMSELDMDSSDTKLHPIRCVHRSPIALIDSTSN